PIARSLAEQIDREKNHLVLTMLCFRLVQIWERVGEKDAIMVARAVLDSLKREQKMLHRFDLANLVANLAKHRREAAAVAAQGLGEAICRHVDWIAPDYLSGPFQQAAVRLRQEDAVTTARGLVAKLNEPSLVEVVKPFSRSLAALASRLGEKEAAATSRAVALRMNQRVHHAADYPELAAALAALASRLPPEEAAAV